MAQTRKTVSKKTASKPSGARSKKPVAKAKVATKKAAAVSGAKSVKGKAVAPKAAAKPVAKKVAKSALSKKSRTSKKTETPVAAKKTRATTASPKSTVAKKAAPKTAPVKAKAVASAAGKRAARTVAAKAAPARKRAANVAAPAKADAKRTQPMTPKAVAQKAAAARQAVIARKPVNQRHGFKTSEYVVYPAHGVGRIVAIEEQEIAGLSLELFVITFEKDKMTLRVPTGKLESVGMRKLAEEGVVKKAMHTLTGKARVKRTMWSRRAQEYEAKINSGDLVSIAEVVRDLYRSETQPEQSYSERQLYEAALDRMARELAAVEKLDERGAVQSITEVLSKSARGRRMAQEAAAAAEGTDAKAA